MAYTGDAAMPLTVQLTKSSADRTADYVMRRSVVSASVTLPQPEAPSLCLLQHRIYNALIRSRYIYIGTV